MTDDYRDTTMFEIVVERPNGTGGSELETFHNVRKFLQVPHKDKAVVTTEDNERTHVPKPNVVSVTPEDNDRKTTSDEGSSKHE